MKRRARVTRLFEHSPADTYLLAAFGMRHWPHRPGACRVLDLGCGAGRLLYEVAHGRPEAKLFGLEVQVALLRQAEKALVRRGMRVGRPPKFDIRVGAVQILQLVLGDVRTIEIFSPVGCFDIVFINPPYFKSGEGRLSPDPVRAGYRHEAAATLDDFLRGTGYVLAPGGSGFSVYPSSRMNRFESTLAGTRLRIAARQEVFPDPGAREPYRTLCLLVPVERYYGTEVLEPVGNPDALMRFGHEQEAVSTA